MYTFLYPFYFLLLIPIFVFIFYLYKKGGKSIVFGDIKILKEIFYKNSIYYKLYYLIVFLILFCFVLIFSNFVLKEDKVNTKEKGIDIILSIDVSGSMLANDMEPNRLEASKNIIKKFISNLESDRLGLIVFAGKAFTSLPLNFDYEISSTIVGNITTDIIDSRLGGTAIGDSIIIASENFDQKSEDREKIIILLTDGDANTGINPTGAIDILKKENNNIKIYTIGIGGTEDAYIVSQNIFGEKFKQQAGKLNEGLLKEISESSGGMYFRATNEKTLENIFNQIEELEKTEIEIEKYSINHDKNIYFIYILIFLFALLFIFKYKKD